MLCQLCPCLTSDEIAGSNRERRAGRPRASDAARSVSKMGSRRPAKQNRLFSPFLRSKRAIRRAADANTSQTFLFDLGMAPTTVFELGECMSPDRGETPPARPREMPV